MAIELNTLTSGSNDTNQSSYVTASISPGTSRLVLATVVSRSESSAPIPTVSGCSLVWTLVNSIVFATNFQVSVHKARGVPTSGALTFDFGGQNQHVCMWSVAEFLKSGGAIAQSAIRALASVTCMGVPDLPPNARWAIEGGVTYGAFGAFSSPEGHITVGNDLTQIHQLGFTDETFMLTEWSVSGVSIGACRPANGYLAGVAIEITGEITGPQTSPRAFPKITVSRSFPLVPAQRSFPIIIP